MKRLLLPILLATMLPLGGWAQSAGSMIINTKAGSTTYEMNEVSRLQYSADGQQQLYLYSDYDTPAATLSVDDINSIEFQLNHSSILQRLVPPLANSRWNDFLRLWTKTESMAGNLYQGGSPFLTLTVDKYNDDVLYGLESMAGTPLNASAFRVPTDSICRIIDALTDLPADVRNAAKGEAMLWEALGMFYQVRLFGAVPLENDPAGVVTDLATLRGKRANVSSLYAYIIRTLEKAIELLPEQNVGGIDKYSAKGLLAKVFLTRAGFSEQLTEYRDGYMVCQPHERRAEDLQRAAELALDVIQHSGRQLMPKYSDIFIGQNNKSDEALISWRWTVENNYWSYANLLQSDLGMSGFGDFGDSWGDWMGPSVDLQDAFGEDALSTTRTSKDARRKATMMMHGDTYDYFYTDLGGFDYTKYINNGYADQGHSSHGYQPSPTKANVAKHLYGTVYDHEQAGMGTPRPMQNGLYTHLLRLADVYLIYCEAVMGNSQTTTDATALDCFYQVRHRGVADYGRPTAITWDDVWKERRLELALEGDRWYDFVRLYYYDADRAMSELRSQRRNPIYDDGYDTSTPAPTVSDQVFTLPYPASASRAEAAAASPRPFSIEGMESEEQINTTVTVSSVSPMPARFGEPLVITGTDLNLVQSVTLPNVGLLDASDYSITATTLTINSLPTTAHNGDIELGVGGKYPVFVPYQVAAPQVTSVTPTPIVGGKSVIIEGVNLQYVESIHFECYYSPFFDTDGTVGKEQFTEQTDAKIVLNVPLNVADYTNTLTVYACNGTSQSVQVAIAATPQVVVLSIGNDHVAGGTETSIYGINMDKVRQLFIGDTEISGFRYESDWQSCGTLYFSIPENMEGGTYHYTLVDENGTHYEGPAVNVRVKSEEIDITGTIYIYGTTDAVTLPYTLSWSNNLSIVRGVTPAVEDLDLVAGMSKLVVYKERETAGMMLVYNGDWTDSESLNEWNGDTERVELTLTQAHVNFLKGTQTDGWSNTALIIQGEGWNITKIAIEP